MALLVGIDEAGYGPHLGPLVVAAAALDFGADAPPEPDLWRALRGGVRKRVRGRSSRVVICDSKEAYARSGGLGVLERGVLGFLAAAGVRPGSLADLSLALGAKPAPDAAPADDEFPPPWHRPEALRLPVAADPAQIESAAAHLGRAFEGIGARACALWASVARAEQLNGLMDAGRNKAAALFTLTTHLLLKVRSHQSETPAHVTMDRHGARRYYAALLAGAFPMTRVETLEESETLSRYLLGAGHTGGRQTRRANALFLTVRERCETWSLPTALASMAAKYVRELHMRQLNAYFRALVPGLRDTAGYGRDAWRFLSAVARAREAAGVPETMMLRNR